MIVLDFINLIGEGLRSKYNFYLCMHYTGFFSSIISKRNKNKSGRFVYKESIALFLKKYVDASKYSIYWNCVKACYIITYHSNKNRTCPLYGVPDTNGDNLIVSIQIRDGDVVLIRI